MKGSSDAQRRAMQARRDRLRAAGLINLNIWVRPEDVDAAKSYDRKHEVRADDNADQA